MKGVAVLKTWLSDRQLLVERALDLTCVLPVGVLAGSASALFLWSLDRVTEVRLQNPWLLFLLPVFGVAMAWLYQVWGGASAKGNNLILDEIHQPGGGVPRRMAPLILLATLVTHLGGGSAGREGTAVQMGGSLASTYRSLFRFGEARGRLILMAGVAAGFGSVFGTPVAGAIFAVEVLVAGEFRHRTLLPMLVAAVVGHITCQLWGIHHASFALTPLHGPRGFFELSLLAKAAVAGLAFGLAGQLFVATEHGVRALCARVCPVSYLRPAVGAGLLIGLVYALGTRDYLGLSVVPAAPGGVALSTSFAEGGVTYWTWFLKLVFTAITLGAGFKGGEVTPLFFIGAALGNVIGVALGAPVDLFAALGFVAVFGGTARTPLACTIMGVEVFGGQATVYLATACFFSYLASGRRGLYASQRRVDYAPFGVTKH